MKSPLALLAFGLALQTASAQYWNDFETAPHSYMGREYTDPMSTVLKKAAAGEIAPLDNLSGKALVARLLKEMNIPVSSQILVFSQTSLQRKNVRPENPRALYFNENVYLGWMPGGRVEVSSIDPELGPIFYFQRPLDKLEDPLFHQSRRCFGCHAGSATNFLPGLLGRSIFPNSIGRSVRGTGYERVSHNVAYDIRWGGWYVTGGGHGSLGHMGNTIAEKTADGKVLFDRAAGGKIESDLSQFFKTENYLAPTSDVLALTVHDHQVSMQYHLNECQYKVRQGLFDAEMAPDSGREAIEKMKPDNKKETVRAIEKLMAYLFFSKEAPFAGVELKPGSTYRQAFASDKKSDASGKSLRDLDLKNRLLKYRCSWMIYSKAFDALPVALREEIYHRMWDILTAPEAPEGFEHLAVDEKKAIIHILADTKTDLPDYWTNPGTKVASVATE